MCGCILPLEEAEVLAIVEWSECFMAQRNSLVYALLAVLLAAQEKVNMALRHQGCLTDIEFKQSMVQEVAGV